MNVNTSDQNSIPEGEDRGADQSSVERVNNGSNTLVSRGINWVRGALSSSKPAANQVDDAGSTVDSTGNNDFSRRDFLKTSAAALIAANVLPNSGCNGPVEVAKEAVVYVVDMFEEAGRDTGEMFENIGREVDLLRRKFPLIGDEPPISATRIIKASKSRSNEDEKLLGEAYDAARPKIKRAMPSLSKLPKGRERDILLSYYISLYVTKEVLDKYNEQCSKRGAIYREEDLNADRADRVVGPKIEKTQEKIDNLKDKIDRLRDKKSNPIRSRQISNLGKQVRKLRSELAKLTEKNNKLVDDRDDEKTEALGIEMQISEVLSGLEHGLAKANDDLQDALEEEREKARESKGKKK